MLKLSFTTKLSQQVIQYNKRITWLLQFMNVQYLENVTYFADERAFNSTIKRFCFR